MDPSAGDGIPIFLSGKGPDHGDDRGDEIEHRGDHDEQKTDQDDEQQFA